ncbi:MAG: hypothetical protein ABI565_10230 [Vicinamibacteria bacterium]
MSQSVFVRLSAVAAMSVAIPMAFAQVADKAGPRFGAFGLDLTAQKTGIKPGDDFWTFANGASNERTEIAADRTSAGVGVLLVDEAENLLTTRRFWS